MRVLSRHSKDWSDKVPAIVEAMRAAGYVATIAGECVVPDGRGVTDFECFRSAPARGGSREGFLFAFDLIERDGRDMRFLPWHTPADFGEAPEHGIRFSEHLDGTEGATAFRHACAMGLQENRGEAARGALSIRPVRRLGEDQKSGRASGNASD